MGQEAAHTSLPRVGDVLAGKYAIEGVLGEGGIGVVFKARHVGLDETVALKVLKPAMLRQPEVVLRFAAEARTAARIKSEHIAKVFDVGTHDGVPFLVMEHLEGSDLRRLAEDGALSTDEVVELAIQACEGLADAHREGVIHRDIKSDNLFVTMRGGLMTLKVLDFGISKVALTGRVSDVDLSSFKTQSMLGSPQYLSPEQIRCTSDVDERTDLWSLGVVLFEVLARGHMPFTEDSELTALVAEILECPHRDLREYRPDLPEALIAVVDRCLEKDRERRFATAGQLAAALAPFAPTRARVDVERAQRMSGRASGDQATLSPPPLSPPPDSVQGLVVIPRERPLPRIELPGAKEKRTKRRWRAVVMALAASMAITMGLVLREDRKPAQDRTLHANLASARSLEVPITQRAPSAPSQSAPPRTANRPAAPRPDADMEIRSAR